MRLRSNREVLMLRKVPKTQEDQSTKLERIAIPPIRMMAATFDIVGITQLVSNNFSKEMQDIMAEKQKKGSQQARKDKKHGPKDFEKDYRGSMHISTEGWIGFPASAFRQGLIDACRTVDF